MTNLHKRIVRKIEFFKNENAILQIDLQRDPGEFEKEDIITEINYNNNVILELEELLKDE